MRRAFLIAAVSVTAFAARPVGAYDNRELMAPAGFAAVVFIQNTRADALETFTVFDYNHLCVAELRGREAEVVPMPPGEHTVYISSYNNHRVDMNLVAGRTYFIRVFSTEKFATKNSNVTLVQRGTRAQKLLKTWLQGAHITHVKDDPCSGKPLRERKNKVVRRINDANATWKVGDEGFRYQYTLLRADGFTAEEVAWF